MACGIEVIIIIEKVMSVLNTGHDLVEYILGKVQPLMLNCFVNIFY